MEPLCRGADVCWRDRQRQDGVWALPHAVPLSGPVVHVPQVHQKGTAVLAVPGGGAVQQGMASGAVQQS